MIKQCRKKPLRIVTSADGDTNEEQAVIYLGTKNEKLAAQRLEKLRQFLIGFEL